MSWALLAPFAAQGLAMLVDEFHFHRSRGLPRWERIGHPLDTLTVIACFAWAVTREPSAPGAIGVYLGLAAFSCLFVTKDEWVHRKECSGGETWLHAVLFILHPICLGAAGWMWFQGETFFLRAQLALLAALGTYQAVYWGWIHEKQWERKGEQRDLRPARRTLVHGSG